MSTGCLCYGCGQKLSQKYGLCRDCGKACGIDRLSHEDAEARMVQGRAAYQQRPVRRAQRRPMPNRMAIFDGYEFDVVFDGRQYFFCEEWS